METLEYVASKIKEFRTEYNSGEGLSQQKLAELLNVASNTISRWETGNYKPSIEDLEKMSKIFGKSILEFLPNEDSNKNEKLNALFRAAEGLSDEDLDELQNYAEFRKARKMYNKGKRPTTGRKRKNDEI